MIVRSEVNTDGNVFKRKLQLHVPTALVNAVSSNSTKPSRLPFVHMVHPEYSEIDEALCTTQKAAA